MTTDDVIKIATPIAVIVAAVIQQLESKRARAEIKSKLEVTAKARDQKLEAIAKTGEAVHVLVNSNMSAALKTCAVAMRRVADITKAKGDIDAANLAEELSRDHEAKQSIVDTAASRPSSIASSASADQPDAK